MRDVAGALCTLLFSVACIGCSAPPQKEIDRAQGALDAARAAGAEQYAPGPFTAATDAMQETHDAVRDRDYRLALSRAVDANELALEAATEAANGKARARADAEAAIARVETAVRQLDERLKIADSTRLARTELDSARRLRLQADAALQEARAAVAQSEYATATAAMQDLPDRIAGEIRALNEAIDARAGRGTRRRG